MTDSADIVISADSHVLEPKDLWIRALGPKYGEGVPRYVEGYGGNPGLYFFTGRHALKVGSSRDTDQVERYQKLETAGRDPAVRLGIMDAERVHAEVLNASWAMLTTSILDAALRRDCARVFNDYLVEYCAAAKKRLRNNGRVLTVSSGRICRRLRRITVSRRRRCSMPKARMPDIDENERLLQNKRNARRTAAALWLIVAAIFFYMIAKYYWMSR